MPEINPKIITTSLGEEKRKYAIVPGGEPIILKYIAVGDGSGSSFDLPILNKDAQVLYHEIWRDTIISMQLLERGNIGKYLVTGYIPSGEVTLKYLKEFGLFTPDNELIFMGHLDNFFMPSVNTGRPIGVIIQVEITWGFTTGLELAENANYQFVTKDELMQEYDPLTARTISKPYLYYMAQIIRHSE